MTINTSGDLILSFFSGSIERERERERERNRNS